MRKVFVILPIVVVVVAATVLGLFAAGVFDREQPQGGDPVAYAVTKTAEETSIFKDLGTDTYFDIAASRKPTVMNMDNYVTVTNSRGDKVSLVVDDEANLEAGKYRIKACGGFAERSTYEIRVFDASFVADAYKDLRSFLFTTKGSTEVREVVTNESIIETDVEGTDVETIEQGGELTYVLRLASAAEARYNAGDVILAKKPDADLLDESLTPIYDGEIAGYAYEGMAAYYVTKTSEIENGREKITCRLANFNEVVKSADIYENLTIDENNFSFDEDALRDALENSEFSSALLMTAQQTYDLFEKSFDKVLNNGEKGPRQVVTFTVGIDGKVITLNIKYTITIAKGVDIIVGIDNTVTLNPTFNCDYDTSLGDFDLELDFALNMLTSTRCYIDMEMSKDSIEVKSLDEFKEKFTELLKGNTKEKAIFGKELPIYSYKYPIYCFVLGVEFGVDLNFAINGDLSFGYTYNTDITAGVTYINDEFKSYKSMTTSQTAEDLVLLGKIEAEAGVYVKLTASVLEVVGIGFKVKVGAYAELGGQLRLDMEAALNKELRIWKGYYVVGGLYLGADFQVKAGLELPVIGYKGVEKTWELAKIKFPLFEYGSKYIVSEILDDGATVQIPGKSLEFNEIRVNAFDLYAVKDASGVTVPLDSFDVEYLDGAEDYVTVQDGKVVANPTVGVEFYAAVKLISKANPSVTGTITFHKTAVMPTCEETYLTFDKQDPQNVTFDVKKNTSSFIGLSGDGITSAYYITDDTGAITIYASFLSNLPLGDHTFLYKSNKGTVSLTVNVTDMTPITIEGATETEPAKATFLKSVGASVSFRMNLNGNAVTAIDGLKESEYDVDPAGSLLVFPLALSEKEAGDYLYTVHAANGTTADFKITVKDDRLPALYSSTFGFSKSGATRRDIKVTFEKYAYTAQSVEAEGVSITSQDYRITDGAIVLYGDYLARLPREGEYTFNITFVGDKTVDRIFKVNVWEVASVVAGTSSATFDKNEPADVVYSIYSSSSTVTLSRGGNNVSTKYYSFASDKLTIAKEYCSALPVGEHKLTVRSGSDATAVTLTVVDSTVPEIRTADGGKLVLTYDKSKGEAPSFEMILGGAEFDKITGRGVRYSVEAGAEGTVRVTISADYLDTLAYGEYTFSVLTTVNRTTLVVQVTDSGTPYAVTASTLEYMKGAMTNLSVTFANFGYDLAELEVTGSDAPGFGEYIFDRETGVFTLTAAYLETLTEGDYTTFKLTFNDPAKTVMNVTVAGNK